MAKRTFDILACLIAAAVFGPPLLIIAALIHAEDRGPVFFLQERLGKNRIPIRVIKFRTMRGGEVTRVGRWLRATGVDEIPQFLNVLRGNMSVVGPRPLTQADVDRLAWNTKHYDKRWTIKPGITGLAQLQEGHSPRISYYRDRRYLRTQTIRLDAFIVLLSFAVNILGKKRIRTIMTGRRFIQRSSA